LIRVSSEIVPIRQRHGRDLQAPNGTVGRGKIAVCPALVDGPGAGAVDVAKGDDARELLVDLKAVVAGAGGGVVACSAGVAG